MDRRRPQPDQEVPLMSFVEGDHVVPTDLPRSFVCRVALVHPIVGADTHLLELQPLEGPWKKGTLLVRLDHAVRVAHGPEMARVRMRSARRRIFRRLWQAA
jgi:hypothetical protein